jgi:hypothetical protein
LICFIVCRKSVAVKAFRHRGLDRRRRGDRDGYMSAVWSFASWRLIEFTKRLRSAD